MMVSTEALLVLFLSFLPSIRATTNFTSPANVPDYADVSQNPTYKVGQTVYIEWVSDTYSKFDLELVGYPSLDYIPLLANTTDTWYEWVVNWDNITVVDGTKGEYVLLFALSPAGKDYWDALSQPFNITRDEKNGLSTGAVAGIAVGSTLGGLIILGGLGFFAWRSTRHIKEFLAWKGAQRTDKTESNVENPPTQPLQGINTTMTTTTGDPDQAQSPLPAYTKSAFEGQQRVQSPELPSTNYITTELQAGQNGHLPRQYIAQSPGGMYEVP